MTSEQIIEKYLPMAQEDPQTAVEACLKLSYWLADLEKQLWLQNGKMLYGSTAKPCSAEENMQRAFSTLMPQGNV